MENFPSPWDKIIWHHPERFSVEEITFHLVSWGSPKKQSTPNNFVLVKDPTFSLSMKRILSGLEPEHIMEFGLYHGASLVLFDKLYHPKTIIGIDERPEHPVLHQYRQGSSAHSTLFPYCGVKQNDIAKLKQIFEKHFPNRDVDLILDDCSHLYEETKSAFVTAFPYLKAGGIYIIEDWGWAHWAGEFQEKNYFEGTPLSKLIFELLMLQSSIPGLITKIESDYHHVAITKGDITTYDDENLFEQINCKTPIHLTKQ